MPNPAPGFGRHPDHRILVEPYPGTVTVRFGDTVVASSKQALELREASYPPVLYLPLQDIYLEHFEKSATTTHCRSRGMPPTGAYAPRAKRPTTSYGSMKNPMTR